MPPEPIIVRRWKDGDDLIAIFPEWDEGGGKVHVWGQQDGGGSGDPKAIQRQTDPVTYTHTSVKTFLDAVKRNALPDGVKDYKIVKG